MAKGPSPYYYSKKAPCKDCADRHEACHDKCERYISFKKEQRKEIKARKEYYDLLYYIDQPQHRSEYELRPNDYCGRKI